MAAHFVNIDPMTEQELAEAGDDGRPVNLFAQTLAKQSEEVQAEALKKFATHEIARLDKFAALSMDQMIKTSGWLSAALLAVNGGGAVATLSNSAHLTNAAWAGIPFTVGILFAIMSGVAIQSAQTRAAQPLQMVIAFWKAVEILGVYDEDEEARHVGALIKAQRWAWTAPILGWISGLCFTVGTVVVGCGLK